MFEQVTHSDRQSQFPNRKKLTNPDNGAYDIRNITRYEGSVTREGTPYSAETLNDLERRIKEGFDDVAEQLGEFDCLLYRIRRALGERA